jgi:hypothetical protein
MCYIREGKRHRMAEVYGKLVKQDHTFIKKTEILLKM